MIRSVNIDGEDYIVRECYSCMFYDTDWVDCKYPKKPSKICPSTDRPNGFPRDCPLGLVKDCFSCKHDGQQQSEDFRCEGCEVWFHADTGIEDPPTKWEAKE